MRQPNPERGLFMDIQKKQFMNIYGSLMGIFDLRNRLHPCFMRQPNPERGSHKCFLFALRAGF